MKKFVLSLIALLLVSALSVGFAACGDVNLPNGNQGEDSRETRLTYVDREGKTVNLAVSETDDSEEVTEVLCTIAANPDQSEVRSLLSTVQISLEGAVTAGEVTQRVDLAVALDAGLGVPAATAGVTATRLFNDAAPYLALSVKGNLPLSADEEGVVDLANLVALDESVRVYGANSSLYAKVTLSNALRAKLGLLAEQDEGVLSDIDDSLDLDNLLDGYVQINLSDMLRQFRVQDVQEMLSALSALDGEKLIDTIVENWNADPSHAGASRRELFAEVVKELHLSIVEAQNGRITFRCALSQDLAVQLAGTLVTSVPALGGYVDMQSVTKALADYDGSSYVTVTYDVATNRFVGVEIDAKAVANCLLASEVVQSKIAFADKLELTQAKVLVSIAYDQAIPAISDADAQSATDVTDDIFAMLLDWEMGQPR